MFTWVKKKKKKACVHWCMCVRWGHMGVGIWGWAYGCGEGALPAAVLLSWALSIERGNGCCQKGRNLAGCPAMAGAVPRGCGIA